VPDELRIKETGGQRWRRVLKRIHAVIDRLVHDRLVLREKPCQIVSKMVVYEWLDRLLQVRITIILNEEWFATNFVIGPRAI
jgi:hypothetical protein